MRSRGKREEDGDDEEEEAIFGDERHYNIYIES
jgi:hypothetical protein